MGEGAVMARFVFKDEAPAAPAARFVFKDEPAPVPVGRGESFVRGAVQGASLGFGDEAAAAVESILPDFLRNDVSRQAVGNAQGIGDKYRSARDFYRSRNAAAEKSNPGTYLGTQIVGATIPTLVGGAPLTGVRGLGVAAGQGLAQGAGYSEANEGRGLASDTALGGALGVAGHGAGAALGAAAKRVAGAASRRLLSARGRALGQAAKEVDEAVASARGQLGAETQAGNRYAENLRRLEGEFTEGAPEGYVYHVTPRENLDPIAARGLRPDAPKIAEGGPHGDTRAVFLGEADTVPTYRDLYGEGAAVLRVRRNAVGRLEPDDFSEGTGWLTREPIPPQRIEVRGPDGSWTPLDPGRSALRRRYAETADARRALEERLAASNLESLPAQAATIAARRAELAALQQAAPQTVATRTGELLKSSAKPDARSFLKAYAEPLVWMGAAGAAGDALDLSPSQQAALVAGAGVVGGRTRAGKALLTRIKKPGNQAAIARQQERLADAIRKLRRTAAIGAPAAIIADMEDETP
jgi:hypothetical protein